MRVKDIKEGNIYRNKGKGKTYRRIISIGNDHRPERFLSDNDSPNEPGVLYEDDKGRRRNLYLSSFAAWAGAEIGIGEWRMSILNRVLKRTHTGSSEEKS